MRTKTLVSPLNVELTKALDGNQNSESESEDEDEEDEGTPVDIGRAGQDPNLGFPVF